MTRAPCQQVNDPRPPPARVLVLGSTGMLGRSWMNDLQANNIECVGVSRPEFDLMDPDSIKRSITQDYDLVVNASAWTNVDGAESDETGATRANGHAVGEIADLCQGFDSTLITYSTDYVFSGDGSTPYPVDAPINPINAYGRSKAAGESKLAESDASSILIRTSWVYAPWGTNFVRTILALARSRPELRVVDDQRGRPTSAEHLAQSSLALYRRGAQGTWHLSDSGECTWHELASEIIRYGQINCLIHPCSSDQYPRDASRPAFSTLDIEESVRLIGQIGSWRSHLHAVLEEIDASSPNQ